ncbi:MULTISPECIES: ABC transporter substrate-binding protein [Streptomyces]|uniref:Iron complex transport system substrate-binding protein n=1 Tax=Streptomyces clavifer TaxID=68188 RepID=A0ABS4VHC2_9ACTN|nr:MULTISPECIES: iron-siderophore ABC transporter substrate-binding protein [Streptomyces]KQZ18700.1 ABC transporter substrate-binding protein [Streptomyces sp. Root55]MBP2363320.1 iron complex transport system substrate-binding protein [Streptomyces clavifer]MDX2747050.1 iron-siderophore ABC transporter substrate-binding protein [Streptomyces sp. NRRL_B-2557]MDX3061039.1 iron-siderophore ABC transporter substrate-binding protein [Streptomyces sp. ND04-05B]RPK72170.1 Fe(3+)-citrate-binding pro
MRRHLLTTAAVAVAALSLAACGTTEPSSDDSAASDKPAEKITLTDATGTKVTLDGPAKKVVATEWNVVEDLITLGVAPVGVADVKGYTAWNTAAPLTGDPKDIGTRGEPSIDTVAALAPDLVVATSDLSPAVVKQLRKVAPVLEITAADAADQIGTMNEGLDLIAKATGTTAQADAAKKDFEASVAEGKKALEDAGLGGAEIASADGYVASNQVSIRAYTSGSLLGAVNEKLGLKNAWTVKGDESYGLATTDVEGLTGLGDVHFPYVANDADGDAFTGPLAKNAVWKSLPFVKAGNVHRLPDGVWMFGGPRSMEAYIDSLVDALTKK